VTETLALPYGYAVTEEDLGIDSTGPPGLIHGRQARRVPRRFTIRWDGRGIGASDWIRGLAVRSGLGADVVDWTPPDGTPIKGRIRSLSVEAISAADHRISILFEEAIEPC
jgi:hypothetical protein